MVNLSLTPKDKSVRFVLKVVRHVHLLMSVFIVLLAFLFLMELASPYLSNLEAYSF